MNNYLLGGVAAIVIAGGAYMVLSGGSEENVTDAVNASSPNASSEVANNTDTESSVTAQNVSSTVSSNDTSSPTPTASGTPRLHPVEAVCIDYVMAGQMMNGTITRCHRNYAYEQYEITNTEVGFAGVTQSQNQHTITIGDTIYAIDLQKNTGTQTANPMYASLAAAVKNSTPEEMASAFIAGMGFSPTGGSKTIENINCTMYSAAQLGNVCLTDDGLMLEQDFMGNTQTAVSVSIGDGGDDANYTLYENVTITQGPDLSNGIGGLLDQMSGNN